MELSEKLRFLRYSHDYSREYVAYRLGVSTEEYVLLEDGEYNLSIQQAEVVSALYTISTTELFGDDIPPEKYADWDNLLDKENADFSEINSCDESIAYLKAEISSIKEMLHVLVEKLGAS